VIFVADLGGSTASIAIFSYDGACLSRSSFPAFTYSKKTHVEFVKTISTLIKKQEKQLTTLIIGSAGLGDRASQRRVYSDLQKVFLHEIYVCADAELALWNAHNINEGLILVLGTGSIFWGREKGGTMIRASGFGPLFDEINGGFSLVRSYLYQLLNAEDFDTNLTERQQFCKIHATRNVIEFSRTFGFDLESVSKLASLSKWVCNYAEQNPASLAAKSLELFSESVSQKASEVLLKYVLEKRDICLLGGLCKNTFLREKLEQSFHKMKITVRFIERENTYGGYLIAKYLKDKN
jgi:N-acetylglucosamine kinase-like BadF-type ATPase